MNERSRDDLEQARAKWWATVSTGDLDGYLALFADDAVWVTPELDEIVGRAAIRAWLEPVFAQFDYELTITVADVRIAGDLGIERARFLSRMTPKPPPYHLDPVLTSVPPLEPEPEVAPTPESVDVAAEEAGDDAEGDDSVAEGGLFDDTATDTADGDAAAAENEGPAWNRDPLVQGEAWGDAPPEQTSPSPESWGGSTGEAPVEGSESTDDVEVPADEPEGLPPWLEAVQSTMTDEGDGSESAEDLHLVADDVGIDDDVEAPLLHSGPDGADDEPHEGRYLMYWRWHDDGGWLVHRYADVTGVG